MESILIASQNENHFSWKDWAFNGVTHGMVIGAAVGVIWLFILGEEYLAGLPVTPWFSRNSAAEAYIGAGLLGGVLFWQFNSRWRDRVRRTTNDRQTGKLLYYCFKCKRELSDSEVGDESLHQADEGHVVGTGWQEGS